MQTVTVTGSVARERVSIGSKSEREAPIIRCQDGQTHVLRLKGEPAFGPSFFDTIDGAAITASGVLVAGVLIVTRYEPA